MNDEERREIEELLPFLANDTLEGDEKARVEAAVAEDAELAGEFAALLSLRDTMRSEAEAEHSPGAFGHARLMRELGRDAAAQMQDQVSLVKRPRFWQVAAALLFAVILGQAAFMSGRDDGFVLAGDDEAGIVVVFAPDAFEADIRTVLLMAGVEIVGGPSALGLYEVVLLEGVDLEAAVETLRGNPAIVESIDLREE